MIKIFTALWMAVALMAVAWTTFAHEDSEEGDYKFVVGFLHEPAYEGEMNAVSVRVTKAAVEDDAHSGGGHGGMTHHEVKESEKPIEGLQHTLLVEVTHVPSETSRTMTLRAVHDDPGHYVADLIPTSPGHYRFRFFGTVEGNPVDETFDSMAGGGGFDDVQVASVIHFPEAVASAREVEGAARGAQAAAQQAREEAASASGATTLGVIGIVVGAIGVALGGGAVFVSLRRGS